MHHSNIFVLGAVALLLIPGSLIAQRNVESGSPDPAPSVLMTLNAEEALELANRWGMQGVGVTSFVTPQAVRFSFADETTVSVPLPEDQMVVAIAPYVNSTHRCEIHYMSGCRGELPAVPVRIIATTSRGETVIDDTRHTLPNGFLELWLPRGQRIEVRIEALGRSHTGEITTFSNSNTCVTTFRLK